jgi:hypothetical protein
MHWIGNNCALSTNTHIQTAYSIVPSLSNRSTYLQYKFWAELIFDQGIPPLGLAILSYVLSGLFRQSINSYFMFFSYTGICAINSRMNMIKRILAFLLTIVSVMNIRKYSCAHNKGYTNTKCIKHQTNTSC